MLIEGLIFLSLQLSGVPKVVFIGDSLTAGYGLRSEEAYPSLVRDALKEKGIEIDLINGGVSGDTTAGGLRRVDWMLRAKPDLVILALGGNDMLRGLPIDQTKSNLEKMIQKIKDENVEVLLLGIHAAPNLGANYEKKFNLIFSELGKKYKIPVLENYISKVAGRFELNLPDGIHPNAKGQQILAKEITEFILKNSKELQ